MGNKNRKLASKLLAIYVITLLVVQPAFPAVSTLSKLFSMNTDAEEVVSYPEALVEEPQLLVIEAAAVAAPEPQSPSNGAHVKSSVTFTQTWTSVDGAVLYGYESCNVDPRDENGVCSSVRYTATFTGTTKTVSPGLPSASLWWRVRSQDSTGTWSNYSQSFELVIDAVAPVITAPANITVEADVSGLTTVNYDGVSASDDMDGAVPLVCTPASGSTFLMGTTPVSCTATDEAGNSSSASFNVIVQDTTVTTPTLLSPENGAVRNTSGLFFDWGDVSDANGPVVYWFRSSWTGGSFGPRYVGTTSQVNSPGTPERIYSWQIQACDTLGNCSAWSNPWTLIVDNTKPILSFTNNVEVGPLQTDIIEFQITTESNPDPLSYGYSLTNDPAICNSTLTFTSGATLTISDESTNGLWVCAKGSDLAGNTSYLVSSNPLNIDRTAPTTTVSIQGDLEETKNIPNANGWHGKGWYETYDNVNVRIATGNPTDLINYQVLSGDVSCPVANDASYVMSVSNDTNLNDKVNGTDGVYTLCYYGEDFAGNFETTVHKQILKIDNSIPSYTLKEMNGTLVDGVYYIKSTDVSVKMDVSDEFSGYTRGRFDLYNADANHVCTTKIDTNQDNDLPAELSTTRTLTKTGLVDGNYCFRVWTYDDVQNKSWFPTNGDGWVKFVVDTEKPTIDTIEDQTFNEGDLVNLGLLDDKGMYDNALLDKAYLTISFVDQYGNPHGDLVNEEFDVSTTGWDGLGGTLNELYEYYTDSEITFGEYSIPIDTSLIDEGIYRFDYYVTDKAGNRSDCSDDDGDQNCNFNVTINNVVPSVELSYDNTVEIYEGDTVNFSGVFADPSYIKIDDVAGTVFELLEMGIYENEPDDANWGIEIDYGEGAGYEFVETKNLPGNVVSSLLHTYTKNGDYTVKLKVCELWSGEEMSLTSAVTEIEAPSAYLDGSCSVAITNVTVKNISPVVTITTNPGDSTNEQSVTMNSNVTWDVNGKVNTPVTYSWTLTDGTTNGWCNGTGTSVTTPAIAGSYTCKVTVTDVDGDSASAIKTVAITENNPTVYLYSSQDVSQLDGIVNVGVGTSFSIIATTINGDNPFDYSFSGTCSGSATDIGSTFISNGMTLAAGSYSCLVSVTDSNGDIAYASVPIIVAGGVGAGQVAGANDNASENNESTNPLSYTRTTTSSVKGEQTCNKTQNLSGTVFVDENDNDKRDENEKGAENVEIIIYDEDNEKVATTKTNSEGKWEVKLCPGDYRAEISKNTLPKDTKVKGESTINSSVFSDLDTENVDFALSEDKAFDFVWWWLLVILIPVLGLGVVYYFIEKQKKID